ncbi:hypothetical protein JCM5296_002517 [Sporobolomyces johnsonii]
MTERDDQLPFAAFSRASEFIQDARRLTSVNFDALPTAQEEQDEIKLLSGLCAMLDEYQEQSYLLDPSLEALVSPLLDALRQNVRRPKPRLATARMQRLARLIYFLTKVRGAKTIVRFFPHEVTDLVLLVRLLSPSSSSPSSSASPSATAEIASSSWELRYVLLLWLSVAVRLPFDLARLDPGTGAAVEEVGMRYLGTASKEREGATEVLARFYARQDAPLGSLLKACEENLAKPETVSIASGLVQTLCEVVKTASPATLNIHWPQLYQLLACLPPGAGGPLLAKYRVKLAGRLALMRLTTTEGDVPQEVEVVLGELLEGLSHTDTIVRWSAAKYIARITSLLPVSFASEIVDAVLGIFEEGLGDSDRAEHGLQGACFAFGELGRRGKIREEEQVDRLLKGVMQALLLDHRRNMQTIGSSVRDSAAYVVWSLARTLSPSQARSYARQLAERLVCVALFDREVAIRRAASAAFQEGVGRWGVFPHGIDVLRKIDFFTVSVRHRAFLEAAPSVAQHPEYRPPIINHLISTGIAHYDPDIRTLSAKALGKVVSLDAEQASGLVEEQIKKLATNDMAKLHGTLLSLAALADSTANLPAEPREELRAKIFSATCSLLASPSSRQLRTSHAVLFAALSSIASSAPFSSPSASSAAQLSSNWFELVHLACEHQEESVHAQAGAAMRRMSEMCIVATLLADLDSRSGTRQQCAVVLLGQVDYAGVNRGKLVEVVERSTVFVQREGQMKAATIEARRNGVEALASILCKQTEEDPLSVSRFSLAFDTLLAGFSDYTTDQRGDVGSWVRISTVRAFARLVPLLLSRSSAVLTQERLDRVIAATAKLAVERLDSVREVAGRGLIEVWDAAAVVRGEGSRAVLRGGAVFEEAAGGKRSRWRNISWASEHILPLLAVPEYRTEILEGALLAVNVHSSTTPFLDFALSLPPLPSASSPQSPSSYTLLHLLQHLCFLGKSNFSSNRLFIPFLGIISSLAESGCLDEVVLDEEGKKSVRMLLGLATNAVGKIKAPARLTASAKAVASFLALPSVGIVAAEKVPLLLLHPQGWLRQQTADELFGVVGTIGLEDAELERLLTETSCAYLFNWDAIERSAAFGAAFAL